MPSYAVTICANNFREVQTLRELGVQVPPNYRFHRYVVLPVELTEQQAHAVFMYDACGDLEEIKMNHKDHQILAFLIAEKDAFKQSPEAYWYQAEMQYRLAKLHELQEG